MYVTRRLSHYKKFPESVLNNPDGPNSGCLVIQDEELETYCCFGMCRNRRVEDLPFPQNKNFSVEHQQRLRDSSHVTIDDVVLIPVLNFPLSANQYYVIKPHGKHKGEAITCSKEEDMTTGCFCNCVKDIKPRPLDLKNIYQQVEIFNHGSLCKGYFYAKSVVDDGFPPYFLGRKGWSVYTKTPETSSLKKLLEQFHPYVLAFFKESMYYPITLEQRWEQIYKCKNQNQNQNYDSIVNVDVSLDIESVFVDGQKAMWDEKNVVNRMIFFNVDGKNGGEKPSVGLKEEVFQRMKCKQERGGGMGSKSEVNVRKEEKFGENSWNEFGCYVLVESFVVRRMDGSVVLTYEFVHTHQLRSKWE